jgi:hypothetical protein
VFRKNVTTSTSTILGEKTMVPYPNPAQDRLIFSKDPVSYLIRSHNGMEVKSGRAEGGEAVLLQGIPSGIYFWEAISGKQRYTGNIVIQ